MTDTIEVWGLVKRYGGLAAVDDVSFTVERGEIFVLLGPNGAGKTTTLEIVEGLRRADGGRATIFGEPAGSRSLAPRVGVMPQEGDLYAGIRAEEAVRLFAAFYADPVDPAELIDRLGLAAAGRTAYRRLSGGERRRLSLALALVGRPEVAFLDEPTAGMDVDGRARTWELVGELGERGATVVITTHLLDEAERRADRVAIMSRGRLVTMGRPSDLTTSAPPVLRFETSASIDVEALGRHLGAPVVASGPSTYRVEGIDLGPETIAKLTRWLADGDVLVRRLDLGPRSLEDVYLELTR